jgi:hypothetical protein
MHDNMLTIPDDSVVAERHAPLDGDNRPTAEPALHRYLSLVWSEVLQLLVDLTGTSRRRDRGFKQGTHIPEVVCSRSEL